MPSDVEGYDRLKGYQLDVMPGESPLMSVSKWNSTTEILENNIKMRLGYGERETFDLLVSSSVYNANRVNYIYVMSGSVSNDNMNISALTSGLYIYRVDSIERLGEKGSPNANNNTLCVMRYSCTLDVLATLYIHENNGSGVPSFTLNARWSRLPMQAVVEPFQVRPAQMMIDRYKEIPSNIPKMGYNGGAGNSKAFWMEVNCSVNANMYTYGFFVIPSSSSPLALGGNKMPSMSEAINEPARYLGVSATAITSMSISYRCPYDCEYVYDSGTDKYYATVWLYDNLGYRTNWFPDTVGEAGAYYRSVFRRENGINPTKPISQDVFFRLSKTEVHLGSIVIRDPTGTIVGNIDTRYAVQDPDEGFEDYMRITMSVRTLSDGVTMTTELKLSDGTLIRYPEGTLPFSSTTYTEYAIAQLSYDRELLAINQEKAMTDAVIGIAASVTNGAMASIASGGLGVLTAGVGAAATVAGTYSDLKAAKEELSAKRDLMKNMPDNLYNSGYGFSYIQACLENKTGRICLALPSGVTTAEAENYIRYHGYPVSDLYMGVTMVQLQGAVQGFLQANALLEVIEGKTSKVCMGYLRNVLDRQLRQGIHFKVIT